MYKTYEELGVENYFDGESEFFPEPTTVDPTEEEEPEEDPNYVGIENDPPFIYLEEFFL